MAAHDLIEIFHDELLLLPYELLIVFLVVAHQQSLPSGVLSFLINLLTVKVYLFVLLRNLEFALLVFLLLIVNSDGRLLLFRRLLFFDCFFAFFFDIIAEVGFHNGLEDFFGDRVD